METWQSNTKSHPLSKVVEDIRKSNPQLVKEVLQEAIETNIELLNLTNNKKQELKSNLVSTTMELLGDDTNSLAVIHAKIMNRPSVKNESFCRHLELNWKIFNLFFILRLAISE